MISDFNFFFWFPGKISISQLQNSASSLFVRLNDVSKVLFFWPIRERHAPRRAVPKSIMVKKLKKFIFDWIWILLCIHELLWRVLNSESRSVIREVYDKCDLLLPWDKKKSQKREKFFPGHSLVDVISLHPPPHPREERSVYWLCSGVVAVFSYQK